VTVESLLVIAIIAAAVFALIAVFRLAFAMDAVDVAAGGLAALTALALILFVFTAGSSTGAFA
jgi:hypothetical protein